MAKVDGGKDCNLVAWYNEDDDEDYSFGWTITLAQSFTLTTETVIHQAIALIDWTFGEYRLICHLHNTDAAGKPTGAPIAIAYHSYLQKYAKGKPEWRIFKFYDWPTLPPGVYAIEILAPDFAQLLLFDWRDDGTSPTYLDGKAWRSLNGGASFGELASTDFMFEIWGWQPPPLPPPTPVISNWAPLELVYDHTATGLKITVTTDIPVHLFMRWTLEEPRTHPQTLIRRGISLPYATRWCFVAFHENEQLEAGDTYTHTFLKEPWAVCETRYFYFIGTKQGEEQPSASPIFVKHREAPPPPPIFPFSRQIALPSDDVWVGFTTVWKYYPAHGYFIVGMFKIGVTIYRKNGVGLRYLDCPIPIGSTITAATLTISPSGSQSAVVVRSKIHAQDSDNPATFASLADYQARPRTTNFVFWDNVPQFIAGTPITSPNFNTAIQEVVNRPGWAPGNSMVVFWDDHDNRSDAGWATGRKGQTYESSPAISVTLTIDGF